MVGHWPNVCYRVYIIQKNQVSQDKILLIFIFLFLRLHLKGYLWRIIFLILQKRFYERNVDRYQTVVYTKTALGFYSKGGQSSTNSMISFGVQFRILHSFSRVFIVMLLLRRRFVTVYAEIPHLQMRVQVVTPRSFIVRHKGSQLIMSPSRFLVDTHIIYGKRGPEYQQKFACTMCKKRR